MIPSITRTMFQALRKQIKMIVIMKWWIWSPVKWSLFSIPRLKTLLPLIKHWPHVVSNDGCARRPRLRTTVLLPLVVLRSCSRFCSSLSCLVASQICFRSSHYLAFPQLYLFHISSLVIIPKVLSYFNFGHW